MENFSKTRWDTWQNSTAKELTIYIDVLKKYIFCQHMQRLLSKYMDASSFVFIQNKAYL